MPLESPLSGGGHLPGWSLPRVDKEQYPGAPLHAGNVDERVQVESWRGESRLLAHLALRCGGDVLPGLYVAADTVQEARPQRLVRRATQEQHFPAARKEGQRARYDRIPVCVHALISNKHRLLTLR